MKNKINITLYQCIPAYKPLATARLIENLSKTRCNVLLDLEDSILDADDKILTTKLKSTAREDLKAIIKLLPQQKFSVRINAISSNELEADKKLLHSLSENCYNVFLPKVETKEELDFFFNEFGNRFTINVCIESQQGISNLETILKTNLKHKISFVFFGNYDFHLDTNTYPIVEQHETGYWKTVSSIIKILENNGFHFGNSAYAHLQNLQGLEFSFHQLLEKCKTDFAVFSLHKTQTFLYQKLINDFENNHLVNFDKYAESIYNPTSLEEFAAKKLKGRSFALNQNQRIITPQEYLLLKRKNNG